MLISELIHRLTRTSTNHGDIEIVSHDYQELLSIRVEHTDNSTEIARLIIEIEKELA